MKKVISIFICAFISISVFAQKIEESIRVGILNGPSAIPVAWLMENYKNAEYTKYADPQALLPKLIKNEIDVGFLPVNVAAKVYNSTNGLIICAAVTGNGNLSVISKNNIKRFSDLKGKTVYVAGQGATPEYMFRYVLEQNGVVPDKDVILDFSIPTAQIAANLIANKIEYAVVPEPFSTIAISKSASVKRVLDLQEEYKVYNYTNENYPLTVMVVRKKYAEENPDTLDAFVENYKQASQWTVINPKACGQLVEKYNLGLASGIVTKAIPLSAYEFIPSEIAKNKVEALLNIFLEYSNESIGGKLPAEDFYYVKKNP